MRGSSVRDVKITKAYITCYNDKSNHLTTSIQRIYSCFIYSASKDNFITYYPEIIYAEFRNIFLSRSKINIKVKYTVKYYSTRMCFSRVKMTFVF